MKPLVTQWPWWSFALLAGNLITAAIALFVRWRNKAVSSLSALRAYLWYSVASGLFGFAVACIVPVGSLGYWYVFAGLGAGFNLALLLLCAQVVDQLIRRDEVLRVKKLWLYLLPGCLGLAVIWNNLYPYLGIHKSLTFDSVCGLISAFVLFGTYITPDEDWIEGYKTVVLGLAWQIVTMSSLNLVESIWHFPAVDIVGPLASMGTLAIFTCAAKGKCSHEPLCMAQSNV